MWAHTCDSVLLSLDAQHDHSNSCPYRLCRSGSGPLCTTVDCAIGISSRTGTTRGSRNASVLGVKTTLHPVGRCPWAYGVMSNNKNKLLLLSGMESQMNGFLVYRHAKLKSEAQVNMLYTRPEMPRASQRACAVAPGTVSRAFIRYIPRIRYLSRNICDSARYPSHV